MSDTNWIDTKNKLPEISGEYLVFFRNVGLEAMSIEWFCCGQNKFLPIDGDIKLNMPTHWANKPDKPVT